MMIPGKPFCGNAFTNFLSRIPGRPYGRSRRGLPWAVRCLPLCSVPQSRCQALSLLQSYSVGYLKKRRSPSFPVLKRSCCRRGQGLLTLPDGLRTDFHAGIPRARRQ
jgi:hypothetical protein